MARQSSETGGLPEDHKPAMARIRLRGWPAIRLYGPAATGRRKRLRMPKTLRREFSEKFSGLLGIGFKQRTNEHGRISWTCASHVRPRDGKDHSERPPGRECLARASSTPASAGRWRCRMLGIHAGGDRHPSSEENTTACQIRSVAAHGAVAVGTYDAGSSLRPLPGKTLRCSLLLDQGVTGTNCCRANAALTPLSRQYEEPSIPYSVKLRAE